MNVEAGRTQAKSEYTTVANSGAPIPDQTPADTTKGVQGTDSIK